MIFLRYLLLPVSILYGIVIFIRNRMYDSGLLPSVRFDNAVIVVGNLSTGGTGKTPMTEYLIRLLKKNYFIATLSRGYGRNTKGFLLADKNSTSYDVGDEPVQFKKKFTDVIVSVDENRRKGIQKLLLQFPQIKVILLDDAFQHRRVKPGFSILLTDYRKMYYDDFILPSGTLREWGMDKKRADVIVVSKAPSNITPVEKRIVIKKINPEPHQQVFFSYIKYAEPCSVFINTPNFADWSQVNSVVLLTGISNAIPLEDYIKGKGVDIISHSFPDHHEFTMVEIARLKEVFEKLSSKNKIIITTEKDAMRLDKPGLVEMLSGLPFYYIPIETTFDVKEKDEFDQLILDYVVRTNAPRS